MPACRDPQSVKRLRPYLHAVVLSPQSVALFRVGHGSATRPAANICSSVPLSVSACSVQNTERGIRSQTQSNAKEQICLAYAGVTLHAKKQNFHPHRSRLIIRGLSLFRLCVVRGLDTDSSPKHALPLHPSPNFSCRAPTLRRTKRLIKALPNLLKLVRSFSKPTATLDAILQLLRLQSQTTKILPIIVHILMRHLGVALEAG